MKPLKQIWIITREDGKVMRYRAASGRLTVWRKHAAEYERLEEAVDKAKEGDVCVRSFERTEDVA